MNSYKFLTDDGLELVGILDEPQRGTDTCIVLCHGFRSDKDEGGNFISLSERLTGNGFAAFRFDFRAHGESGGRQEEMTISGEAADLDAALKFLEGRGYARFGVVAASFSGGAVSVSVPRHLRSVKALVLLYSRLDFNSYMKRLMTDEAKSLLDLQGFVPYKGFMVGKALVSEMSRIKPMESLKGLDIPLLFVHGDKDMSVPYSEAVRDSETLGAGLVTIKGGNHGFRSDKEGLSEALDSIISFFSENLSPSGKG